MKAIAFSEHGNVYDWVLKKQLCDKTGIKYIHGIETYVCRSLTDDTRGGHIGLYARNLDGVKELNLISSIATSKGKADDKSDRHMYYNPRISLDELMNTSDNIIVTSACLASPIWKWNNEEMSAARTKLVKWMAKNKHRCFLEIQYHEHIDQIEYNKLLYKISQKTGIPLIAGTDTHSSSKYKAECRLVLQRSKNIKYAKEDAEDAFDLTFKTYDELVEMFRKQNSLPEEVFMKAIENTNVFADMVEDFTLDRTYKYPDTYGDNAELLFRDTIKRKYNKKVKEGIIDGNNPKYKINIKEEFNAFKAQGMESFMLFMSELCDYCNENDIPYGHCRGSVGGSTIAYILDIIDLDPVIWNTVFSRFCNADRISLADIDIDYAPKDRPKVYAWIQNKLRTQCTSYIAQFGTLQDRGTIDVLGNGLGYKDLDLVAEIKNKHELLSKEYTKIIQSEINMEDPDCDLPKIDFDNHDAFMNVIPADSESAKKLNNLKSEFELLKEENKDLFYYFDGIKGTIISKGHHPAGMIGSPITLYDNIGVFFSDGNEDFPVASCAMKAVDSLNYVKFDILGLKTIGILKDSYKYIGTHYKKSHEINWEDQKVWEDMITSRIGIFQFQKEHAHDQLKQFKPTKINDMSMVNSAIRPSGKSFRDKLLAREFNKNPSKEIDELLKDNYGWLLYQEDSIKFLTDICGFTGSEADNTRRGIGKKCKETVKNQLPKILDGYCKTSIQPREIAEVEAKAFLKIIDDSARYQFGYNHSTGYSMNGYHCAYQRTYHPLEFITAYLNNADNMEDIKLGTQLAIERGIQVKHIEFGKSGSEYTLNRTDNTIYKGIESIKWCNSKIADELLELSKNEYTSFIDLVIDIKRKTSVDARQLNILTGLNFFKQFGENQYLLDMLELYYLFYSNPNETIKQIKFCQMENFGVSEYHMEKYAGKKCNTLYKEIDVPGLMMELSKTKVNKPMKAIEYVKFEIEYLEYTTYINKKAPLNAYIIVDYWEWKNASTTPNFIARNLRTGNEVKARIKQSRKYKEDPFGRYSILNIPKFSEQNKKKKIGKETIIASDGTEKAIDKWAETDETEFVLEEWEVLIEYYDEDNKSKKKKK